jgi:hypothetical protein
MERRQINDSTVERRPNVSTQMTEWAHIQLLQLLLLLLLLLRPPPPPPPPP